VTIARWQIRPGSDGLIVEVSQGIPVESGGLLESIILSVVLLRSGYSLGDSQDDMTSYVLPTTTVSMGRAVPSRPIEV
jgi:hypothetical protein